MTSAPQNDSSRQARGDTATPTNPSSDADGQGDRAPQPTHAVETYKVVIIGSGFGGQCAAIQLMKRGIHDFRILERRSFMGGTWMQNRYPGAAVDVQSPLYSFSFEPYAWSQMYAEREELERYTKHVIAKHGLAAKTQLSTNVEEVRWDEQDRTWHIDAGERRYQAQFVVNASGPLSTPVIPEFEGRERFAGPSFHSNAWDQDVDHRGKRVAVIGSGASAAQIIPAIVDEVAELHVFQRTPHWVLPRPDHEFSGVERALLSAPPIYHLVRKAIYWKLEQRVIAMKYSIPLLKLVAQREALAHLKEQVADRELRRMLTPDYTIGCKRILLSNTLLPALGHRNTTLRGKDNGIAEITETGITTTQGEAVDVDVIVYATGFDAATSMISYPVLGRDGAALQTFWEDYPRAYLGTAVPDFPNFFVITGPNTGIGHTSAIFMIESQMNYVVDAIVQTIKRGARSVEVRRDAEQDYTDMVHREMEGTVWEGGGCDSWYRAKSGRVIAMFPGFSFTFRHLARRVNFDHHIFA